MHQFSKVSLALAMAASVFASSASASTVTTEDLFGRAKGCVGTWSAETFGDCAAPERDGYAGGEIMARFSLRGRNAGAVKLAPGAGSQLASYFSLMHGGKGSTGSWSYDPTGCDDCFVITSFVVRAGGVSRWFYADTETGLFSGDWSTFGNRAARRIAFYGEAGPIIQPVDGEANPIIQTPSIVPVPATGLLLLGGIAAMAGLRRRRARAS